MLSAKRCAAFLGLFIVLVRGLQAQETSVQTVQLVYTPLMAPELVISRPSEQDFLGFRNEPSRQGSRVPVKGTARPRQASTPEVSDSPGPRQETAAPRQIQFGEKRSATLDLCGETISLAANLDGTVSLRVGEKSQLLRPVPRLGTLQSAFLTFGENRKYLLAFPERSGSGGMTLSCRSGAAQVATINGESIWFYDSNTDGVYRLDDDAVRVGDPAKMAVFASLSSHITTAAGIYEIVQLAEDGSQLQYRKYTGATGRLDVKFAGGSTELNLLLASADGRLNTIVTAGNRARPPVTLMPGHYKVIAAIITAPGSGKVVSIIDSASIPSIDIAQDEVCVLECGSPLTLEFRAQTKDRTDLSIDGASVKIRGKSGEAYSNVRWTAAPEVSLVSAGVTTRLGKYDAAGRGENGSSYLTRIPEIRGHASAKVVITGSVEGIGYVRGESQLE
jgi:hypothetical protein